MVANLLCLFKGLLQQNKNSMFRTQLLMLNFSWNYICANMAYGSTNLFDNVVVFLKSFLAY